MRLATFAGAIVICAAAPAVAEAAEPVAPRQATAPPPTKKEIDPKSRILWLDAEGGVQSTQLNTFTQNFDAFSVGFIPRSGIGPSAGAAAGVRFVFLTLGVRGRVASFEDTDPGNNVTGWSMASVNGEIGIRAPLKRFEPYAAISAGYTTFGGLSDAIAGVRNGLNVNGANFRLGFGFDYFLARNISLGALASAEVLALTRPGVPVREVAALPASRSLDVAAVRFLESNGSTYGTALALTAGLKAHF